MPVRSWTAGATRPSRSRSPGVRRERPRGRAVGRVDGRVRGGRAARRRRRLPRQGRDDAVAQRQRRDRRRPSPASTRATRQAVDRALLDARRHAEQGEARRQRDPRRLAGRGAGRRGRGRAAALALPRRRRRARAAGADDERPQRRRARRQQGRLPGVHDRPVRRADASRTRCGRRRGLPRAQEAPARARAWPRPVGDEGGFAPDLELQRGGAADADRGRSRRPATRRARTSASRSTRATSEFYAGRRLRPRARGPQAVAPTSWPPTGPRWPAATRSSRSRTAWTRTTGTAGSCSPTARRQASSSSATTSS